MKIFNTSTLEGLIFLEKTLISGFNLEDDDFLNVISLNLKYYHNSPEHILFLTEMLSTEFKKRFNTTLRTKIHEKTGIFRWEQYFDDEPGYAYFIVERKEGKVTTTAISHYHALTYNVPGFVIAKDHIKVLDLFPANGQEGEFLYTFLREKCSKKIFREDQLVDNPAIDEQCHQVPLFVVKDYDNLIKDKSGLVKVVNLKFIKKGVTLQSLVTPVDFHKILARFRTFECEFELKKETRYVSLEFAQYMK